MEKFLITLLSLLGFYFLYKSQNIPIRQKILSRLIIKKYINLATLTTKEYNFVYKHTKGNFPLFKIEYPNYSTHLLVTLTEFGQKYIETYKTSDTIDDSSDYFASDPNHS